MTYPPSLMARLRQLGDQRSRITHMRAELALRFKQRDEDIRAALYEGATERDVANFCGLSEARVRQIGRKRG